MEVDKDHIHILLTYDPTDTISRIVSLLKQITTYKIWQSEYSNYLKTNFWKEHTFWSDGYFACSVGLVCQDTVKKYIEHQG